MGRSTPFPAFSALTDVDLTDVGDGDLLKFDASSETWVRGMVLIPKPAAQGKVSTDLSPDDDFVIPVEANERIYYDLNIVYTGDSTGDLRLKWEGPAGCFMRWGPLAGPGSLRPWEPVAAATAQILTAGIENTIIIGTGPGESAAIFRGMIQNGANAGDVVLTWCQNTAHGFPTTLNQHSWLEYRRG